jgi:hypothetical protein
VTRLENVGAFIREKIWLRLFSSQNFSSIITPTFSNLVILHTHPPMKMKQCSETSAYKIQTPVNYPEENIKQICASLCHTAGMLRDASLSDAVFKSYIQQSIDVPCVILSNYFHPTVYPSYGLRSS